MHLLLLLLFMLMSVVVSPKSAARSCGKVSTLHGLDEKKVEHIEMVVVCPQLNISREARESCEGELYEHESPVFTNVTKIFYKNRFCAACHGVVKFKNVKTQMNCQMNCSVFSENFQGKFLPLKSVRKNCTITLDLTYINKTNCNKPNDVLGASEYNMIYNLNHHHKKTITFFKEQKDKRLGGRSYHRMTFINEDPIISQTDQARKCSAITNGTMELPKTRYRGLGGGGGRSGSRATESVFRKNRKKQIYMYVVFKCGTSVDLSILRRRFRGISDFKLLKKNFNGIDIAITLRQLTDSAINYALKKINEHNEKIWEDVDEFFLTWKLTNEKLNPQNDVINPWSLVMENILCNRTMTDHIKNRTLFWIRITRTLHQKGYQICDPKDFNSDQPRCRIELISESLSLKENHQVYYTITNSTLKCRNAKINLMQDIDIYLSFIVTCLSVICYSSVIITYIRWKEFHTLPGYHSIFLCLSLLVSDLLYLFLPLTQQPTSIGKHAVAMHWIILVTYMWALVVALNVANKFRFNFRRRERHIMRRLVLHCTYAYGVPTLIVVIARSVKVEYGSSKNSIITNGVSRIVFYIAPVGLMSMLTCLALVYSVYKIREKNTFTDQGLLKIKKRRSSTRKIALKLFLVLGIAEVVGFIQLSRTNPSKHEQSFNECMGLAYSLVRSARGVFIWIVYIFVKRTLSKSVVASSCKSRYRSDTTETPV